MTNIKISNDFYLSEYLNSNSATRNNIKEQFNPPQSIINNIVHINNTIIQPYRTFINSPLIITSGYRCKRLNDIEKGSINSEHIEGRAVDFHVPRFANGLTYSKFREWLLKNKIEFNQLIWEYGNKQNPAWIHISVPPKGLIGKKQIFSAGV